MDVLLPNFVEGDRAAGLGLDGTETLDCAGLDKGGTELTISAKKPMPRHRPSKPACGSTHWLNGTTIVLGPSGAHGTRRTDHAGPNRAHALREMTALTPTDRTDSAN